MTISRILIGILGVLIGVAAARIFYRRQYPIVGNWHFNLDDPAKDVIKVEFTGNPYDASEKKYIVFQVINEKNTDHNRR